MVLKPRFPAPPPAHFATENWRLSSSASTISRSSAGFNAIFNIQALK
jgi:hypothetical protein